jgi:ribose transport system permease protein
MTATAEQPATDAVRPRRPARSIPVRPYALILVWLATIPFFAYLNPDTFLTTRNISNVLSTQAVLVILTVGLILPLTSGDIDLSVASTLGFASILVAELNVEHEWGIALAVIASIAAGAIIGLINGLICVYLRIDAIITTLGVGTITAGLTIWLSGGTTISGVSRGLVDWTFRNKLFGVSMQFYYAIALAVAVWFLFEYTRTGRRMLVVGRGTETARLAGINVSRTRLIALTGAGALAGIAGVLYTGTSGAADPTSGSSFFLPAFAAAFLGSTAIKPGRFNAIGCVVAAYFLATGINALQLSGAQFYVQQLFYGTALIVAVALSQMYERRLEGGADG